MDAIQFLINEHQKVKSKLTEIQNQPSSLQKPMFNTLCQQLLVHEEMEQTLWYPQFKDKLSDIVNHLISEKSKVEKNIKELELTTEQKEWDEKFSAFKCDIEHHAFEEETKLLPRVTTILDKNTLEAIGKEMQKLKIKHQTT